MARAVTHGPVLLHVRLNNQAASLMLTGMLCRDAATDGLEIAARAETA